MGERPFAPSETRGRRIVWLLELTWASRTWRWASEDLRVTGDDGTVYVYRGGLGVEFEQVADFFGAEPSDPSVSIEGLLFPEGIDVAELIEQGHILERAPVELAQWVEGRTYEQRIVRVVGYATAPDYGAAGEPVAMDIEPPGLRDLRLVPDAEARITTETFPDAAEEEAGKYYPRIYGRPGRPSASVTAINGGAPAAYVDTVSDYILIGDGWLYGSAPDVRVINTTGLLAETLPILKTEDDLGRKVTLADASGAAAGFCNAGDEYWSRLDVEFAEGGLPNDQNSGPLEGAGEVLVDLLRLSVAGADLPRWRAVKDLLDTYTLAFYLDEPKSPLDVIRQMILPLLPIALINGPDGIYPVVWRSTVAPSEVLDELDASMGLERDGRVQYEQKRLANEIRIEYAPRSDGGDLSASVTVTGRDVGGDSVDVYTALIARTSRARFGELVAPTVRAPVVEARSTAARIASWMIEAYAYPWRTVAYRDLLCAHAFLRAGDPVAVTDSDIHWSSAICWVVGERWEDSSLTLTLLRIDNPVRDARAT